MDYNIIKGKSTLTNILDVYSGNLNYTISEYTDNGIYLCKIPATNTTTVPTLNLNGIGAAVICKNNGGAVEIGELLENGWYQFMYDLPSNKFLKLDNGFVNSEETVWNDVLNLENMVSNVVTDTFKPQYTINGNRIEFRGMLYIPLENASFPVDVTDSNSYLYVASAITDETRMSIISNANTNNGTPQGRFCNNDVTTKRNLPIAATPLQTDIVWTDVPSYRRYSTGSIVTVHRTFLTVRVCGINTLYKNGVNNAVGSIGIFSPFNSEYDGSGSPPSGNDPQGLSISRATVGLAPNDYVGSMDDVPFAIGTGLGTAQFSVNAHNITSLGGFIVNLQGLSGYLN